MVSYHLKDSASGMEVDLIDHGATVTRILTPDRRGSLADVLLGCPTPEDYLRPHPHFNCLVGRYANRITDARFQLDGILYELDANVPPHHLHGGKHAFGLRRWSSEAIDQGVRFTLISPDGEGGYPGELDVVAEYTLHGMTLGLRYSATTTRPTPISLSSHHYYNLSGIQGSAIDDHQISINAAAFLPVSAELTQLGRIESVTNTPFDLQNTTRIGDRLGSTHEQIQPLGGFDHAFVITGQELREAAHIIDPYSGRSLTVRTDQPSMQLYTTNTLRAQGKEGIVYQPHQGICLETQQFPDAPNQKNYPDPILRPGEIYTATTEFVFGRIND